MKEPLERIVSAYRNKLETVRDDSFGSISSSIYKQYTKDPLPDKEGFQFSADVSVKASLFPTL